MPIQSLSRCLHGAFRRFREARQASLSERKTPCVRQNTLYHNPFGMSSCEYFFQESILQYAECFQPLPEYAGMADFCRQTLPCTMEWAGVKGFWRTLGAVGKQKKSEIFCRQLSPLYQYPGKCSRTSQPFHTGGAPSSNSRRLPAKAGSPGIPGYTHSSRPCSKAGPA